MIKRDLYFDTRQLAWLVGLMEGEGAFSKATPAMPRKPRIVIKMTDCDIIERVCALWGTRLYVYIPKVQRYKVVFSTELVGGSAVAMMLLLRPHLCARRQDQIDEAAATYQPLRSIKHKSFHVAPEGAEEFDRYWLAGLLEGEGSFGFAKSARGPIVETQSVDYDVMLRLQSILKERYAISVNLHTRPPRQEGYQPQYHLACLGNAARAVMADIEPLMGARRSARIAELLGPAMQPRLIREAGPCYDVRRAA